MSDNRVSASLSKEDREAVLAAFNTIKTKLPFLIDLTKDERVALPKMGDKSRAFVTKANEDQVWASEGDRCRRCK
jgi:hypothetical protein